MTKRELLRHFYDVDYRACMIENGHNPNNIAKYVKLMVGRFADGNTINRFEFSPWCLEFFPELNDILDDINET